MSSSTTLVKVKRPMSADIRKSDEVLEKLGVPRKGKAKSNDKLARPTRK